MLDVDPSFRLQKESSILVRLLMIFFLPLTSTQYLDLRPRMHTVPLSLTLSSRQLTGASHTIHWAVYLHAIRLRLGHWSQLLKRSRSWLLLKVQQQLGNQLCFRAQLLLLYNVLYFLRQ